MTLKKVKCDGPFCAQRRVHYENQFTMRGKPIEFDVPVEAVGPYFCSIECWSYYKGVKRNGVDEHGRRDGTKPSTE